MSAWMLLSDNVRRPTSGSPVLHKYGLCHQLSYCLSDDCQILHADTSNVKSTSRPTARFVRKDFNCLRVGV
jgi:hypothetical protein